MNEIINVLLNDRNLQVIILLFLFLNQNLLLPFSMSWFRERIQSAVTKRLLEIEKEEDGIEKAKKVREKLGSEEYTEYRTRELGFITKTIGLLEVVFFTTFAYLDPSISFLAVLGVWLGIKTATSYGQWDHPIAGKAYFYTSLIGTLINIGLPVIVVLFIK